MDDDAPLSALALKPKVKVAQDDDTPLFALASSEAKRPPSKGGAKGGKSGSGGAAAPKAGGGSKGRGKGLKRKLSDSSSSSSSSSDSSDSSDEKAKKPKKITKKKTSEGLGENKGGKKKEERSAKDLVVAEFLCRWWYVLPDWPPNNEAMYQEELRKRNLRKVKVEEWEWVPEEDDGGRRKVYELSQFRGVFRNSASELIDLRPQETCPCYKNLVKKDLPVLYEMLVKAYESQIAELANSKYDERILTAELKTKLVKVKEKAFQAKQMGAVRK
eukprot:CAMPEP_0117505000 /NCGR_PEP_ID=MMETSP0784-20121206/25145_1 /TAXON_ID=39447 /ORGANISM="" /LENGTH=272 /DNA_ID=CAMNT_0005300385 /DNA_START=53 /DNA_END=871 /DNA_ORIENTATION=-